MFASEDFCMMEKGIIKKTFFQFPSGYHFIALKYFLFTDDFEIFIQGKTKNLTCKMKLVHPGHP